MATVKHSKKLCHSSYLERKFKENTQKLQQKQTWKPSEIHGSITLIQGSLMRKKSLVDEDIIIEESTRIYRLESEWIGLQERKKIKTN